MALNSILLNVFLLIAMGVISGTLAGIDLSNINVNDIQQQLPAEFANSNFSIDNAKGLFRDKCISVAGTEKGEEAFKEIETGTMELSECISKIINYTQLQIEIDEAKPRGELDVVFNKYCNKRPEALECVETFNSKLVPCLDKDEQDNQDVFMRIVRSLLSFVCHKGGDQIALFIAEKGPECLKSKSDDIQQCINSTFSGYMPKEGIEEIKTLPKFVMSQRQCDDIQKLENCIVKKLEDCEEITPANIVESMFRFIKNETICRTTSDNAAQQMLAKNNATTIMLSLNFAIFVGMWNLLRALGFFGKIQIA